MIYLYINYDALHTAYACNSSNSITISKRITPGSNLVIRVKVGLGQFNYCGSIGGTPSSPKRHHHRKTAAPVPFLTHRRAFSAFLWPLIHGLGPLRANNGTPGERKRVCALQKNVEIRATWESRSPCTPSSRYTSSKVSRGMGSGKDEWLVAPWGSL